MLYGTTNRVFSGGGPYTQVSQAYGALLEVGPHESSVPGLTKL
jgi:hypothetical protein